MSFLRRLYLFALAWHAARWPVPTDVRRTITLIPEMGRVVASLGQCCQVVHLEIDHLIGLHSDLDNAARVLMERVERAHAWGGRHVLDIAKFGKDQ